jgi:cell division septation protein DedD
MMRTLMGAMALSITTMALTTVAVVPALADTKAGVDAWNRGDYTGAVTEWRKAAIAGDPDAQFNLGQAYKLGRGVPVDIAMAESWYRKAAQQGHVQASDNYGLALFQDGKQTEALPWLEKSAARGEPRAQLVLGTMLFNGDNVERDWVRAYALMVRSSAAGLPQGSQTLAEMDKYIPEDQRQRGLVLAKQYEAQSARTDYQPEVAGGGTTGPAVRPTDVPPSSYAQRPADQLPTTYARRPTSGFTAGPQAGATYAEPDSAPLPAPVKVRKPKPGKTPPPQIAYAPPAPPAPPRNYTYTPEPVPVPDATTTEPARVPVRTAAAPVRAAPVRTTRPAPAPVATAPAGGWRVQFGAFRDEGNARSLWAQLHGKVGALGGLQPYLRKTGAVTKLQAGPLRSAAEAERVCRTVKASGTDCLPVAP